MALVIGGCLFLILGDNNRRLGRIDDGIRSLLHTLTDEKKGSAESEVADTGTSLYDEWRWNVGVSAMQRLRDSGLFSEWLPQSDGTVRFQLRGEDEASIYVLSNDQEIQIRIDAFQNDRFPNNTRLYDFAREHAHGEVLGEGNPAYAFRLDGGHLDEIIAIIREGQ